MGHQVARLVLPVLLAAHPALAQDAPFLPAAGASVGGSADSDRFHVARWGAMGYLERRNEWQATGIGIDAGKYTQDTWRRDFEAVAFRHVDRDRATGTGLLLDLALSRQGGHTLAIGEAEWSKSVAAGTQLALVGGRGWVETAAALDGAVHFDLAGASVDQALGGGFTAVGFLAKQRFSDGNIRTHERARLIHALWPEMGVTVQLRARHYASSLADAKGLYFNPPRYTEGLAVVAVRRRFEGGWTLRAEAGTGRQWVADDPQRPSRLAALELARAIEGNVLLRGRAAYRRSAAFGGPDYSWRELALECVIGF